MVSPASFGTDALLQCCSHIQVYAFPPFRLVRQVFNEFWKLTNCEVTLVAPWWPQQEYFSDIQRLARFPPVALPLRRVLLQRPRFVVPISIRICCTHGWKLWGVLRGCRVFYWWLVSWPSIVGLPRSVSINHTGWRVGVDVVRSVVWCPLFLWRRPRFSFVFADVTRIFLLLF